MTKKEILLKQRNAENAPLTNYIGTDGYVWKMIENAMEEYAQQVKSGDLADVGNLVLLAKRNYKAKDGTIKQGIEIDGEYYAPQTDC